MKKNSLSIQIGGRHYKKWAYQPVEFAVKASLNFIQGSMVKYLVRYKDKNGKQDLEKVIHYAQLGSDLNPINFFTDRKELFRFISENNLNAKVAEIISFICYQDWTSVMLKVESLMSEEYAAVS